MALRIFYIQWMKDLRVEAMEVENPSSEIVSAAVFCPVSSDVITTSYSIASQPTVSKPSLSAPAPCEENTGKVQFNFKKDVLDVHRTSPPTAAKYNFKNIQERFQPTTTSSSDDEIGSFEFPLGSRNSCDENRPGNKKRKSQDIGCINKNPSSEILSTTEDFLSHVITRSSPTESQPTVATVSLLVPVPCEENTDEVKFNLKKDVQGRFQPTTTNSSDDESDPSEFPCAQFSKRKRKSCDEKRPGNKKRKSQDIGCINKSTSCQDSSLKDRFWKIVKTRVICNITSLFETKTDVIYTAPNGVIITKESDVECSHPTFKTTTSETETREKVEKIPRHIMINNTHMCDE